MNSSATISKFDCQFDVNGRIKQWTQQAGAGGANVYGLAYDYEEQLTDVTISSNSAPMKAFAYAWDAENRLVAIDITNAGGPDLRSEFTYDARQSCNQNVGQRMDSPKWDTALAGTSRDRLLRLRMNCHK